MQTWVVFNYRSLWEIYNSVSKANEAAAKYDKAIVRPFDYGEGDKVVIRDGEVVTIVRPATSVTGAMGYKVQGAKHGDFIAEKEVKGLAATTPWKDYFSHLVQVALAIGEEKRDLTEAEYKAYESEGGGDIVDDFCNNLTDKDVENFVTWARAVAARGKAK